MYNYLISVLFSIVLSCVSASSRWDSFSIIIKVRGFSIYIRVALDITDGSVLGRELKVVAKKIDEQPYVLTCVLTNHEQATGIHGK